MSNIVACDNDWFDYYRELEMASNENDCCSLKLQDTAHVVLGYDSTTS